MRTASRALIVVVLGGLAACSTKQPASSEAEAPLALDAIATTKQVMLGITIPTSDVVFQVGAHAPADDTEWEKVQANALSLAESGNLLMMGPRLVDRQDWLKNAQALIATAKVAAQAAQERNVDNVLAAGDQIYEVCDGCHKKYMPARNGE